MISILIITIAYLLYGLAFSHSYYLTYRRRRRWLIITWLPSILFKIPKP